MMNSSENQFIIVRGPHLAVSRSFDAGLKMTLFGIKCPRDGCYYETVSKSKMSK